VRVEDHGRVAVPFEIREEPKKSPFPGFYASSAINVNAARDKNPLRVSCLFSV
jgi:hypothetical protein